MKLFLLLCAVAIISCSQSIRYVVDVDSYSDGPRKNVIIPKGATIHVALNPNSQNPLLDRETKRKFEYMLSSQGYHVVTIDQAEFILLFTSGIGTGRQVSYYSPLYIPGEVTWIGGDVNATAVTSGSVQWVPTSKTVFDRWLTVQLVDGKTIYDSTVSSVKWQSQVTSSGSSSDLRSIINYMLVALFQDFGKNTGERKRTELYQDNSTAKKLRDQ